LQYENEKISEFDEPRKFVEAQGRLNHAMTSERILNRTLYDVNN
jgi:hypothetical protein